ncbi:hypothetical protein DFH29DRAFT_876761 [Suillus ampliporus]|nr:hypothetical protein DFH29DRAFT_876761 [Suillus ampliporus]
MRAEAVCDILRWCGMRSPSTDKKRGKGKEWVTRDVDVMKTGRVVCKRRAGGSGFIAAFGQALKSHIKVIAYLVPCTAHNSICESSFEVPIFAKIEPDVECMQLDLQAVWLRPSDDGDLHHMYAWPLINYNCRTIIIAAMFPFGHYPEPLPQLTLMPSQSSSGCWSITNLQLHQSLPCPLHLCQIPTGFPPSHTVAMMIDPTQPPMPTQIKYPDGKKFCRSLVEVQICREDLDHIVSVKDQTVVTEEEILTMTGKWLSSFLSDIKRLVKLGILSPAPLGFSLLDQAPRVMKGEWALALMQRLLLPDSRHLPIADNGFVWFLNREITKSLIYHVVFWASILAFIPTTMVDFAPAIFRDAPHPPPAMLAFVGASCYSAILQWLAELLKAMSGEGESSTINLSVYPPPSQIYAELLLAAILLLVQHDDPGYPVFVARMTALCNILNALHSEDDIKSSETPGSDLRTSKQGIVSNGIVLELFTIFHRPLVSHSHCYQGHRPLVHRYRIATAKPSSNTPSTTDFLEIEQPENTLKAWLQKQGREILPDSLFITVSILFGWVDPLDLITVLQVNLNVVVMEKQLQQGELTSISFLLRGGRCYMEERMYRAQMEVTLFSKAIANLCEELDTKYYPQTLQLYEHERLSRSWVGGVTYRAYISTSYADYVDNKPLGISINNTFTSKKEKSLDILKSDFQTLELKKHRAQAKVELFSEAIACTAESQYSDDDLPAPLRSLDALL